MTVLGSCQANSFVAGCSEEASSCGYGLYTEECSVIGHIGVKPSVEFFQNDITAFLFSQF